MAFNITVIMEEVAAAPSMSPLPDAVARATLNEVFTEAGVEAVTPDRWAALTAEPGSLAPEQLRMLAWLMRASPTLRASSVDAIMSQAHLFLAPFLDAIEPITAEMIRANRFRQEEVLRRWASVVGTGIEFESRSKSRKRLTRLDYKKTLKEYTGADAKAKAAEEARIKALEEARQREADSRGWRE